MDQTKLIKNLVFSVFFLSVGQSAIGIAYIIHLVVMH